MVKLLSPWVQHNKDGKMVYRARYRNPFTLKYSTVSVKILKDTSQAKRLAFNKLQKKAEAKIQSYGPTKDLTLDNIFNQYLAWSKSRNLPPNSIQALYYQIKLFEKDVGKDTILTKLTPSFFNNYFDKMFEKRKDDDTFKYSNSGISQRRTQISGMYNYAVAHGLIAHNPLNEIKLKYRNEGIKQVEEKNTKFLTDEEYKKILAYCDKQKRQDYHDFFEWLYGTGMRVGEACAIEASDVFQDTDGQWKCKVTGSLAYETMTHGIPFDKKWVKTDSAKTFAGNRTIVLQPSLVKIYKTHKNNKTKDKISGKNDFLFVNQISHHVFNRYAVGDYMRTMRARLDFDKPITSHMFRHTHISNLAEKHVPLDAIMQRVGQADSNVTRTIYTHVTENQSEKLMDVLKDM